MIFENYQKKFFNEFTIFEFEELASTNLFAKKIISLKKTAADRNDDLNFELDNLVIKSFKQTAGVGTNGREWKSPLGNLYFTLITKNFFLLKESEIFKISESVAIILKKTFLKFYKKNDLKIKWPNDILIHDRKISGILIEFFEKHLILGIGVNINFAPTCFEQKTTALNENLPNNEKIEIDEFMFEFLKNFQIFINEG